MIKQIINYLLNSENKSLISKYIFISLASYTFIFILMFILVDIFEIGKSISFFFVYALNYIFLYTIQLNFLFKTKHSSNKLRRFFIVIFIFYLITNLLYNLGLQLNLNYLVSTFLTIVLLFPLRFLVSKKIMFKLN